LRLREKQIAALREALSEAGTNSALRELILEHTNSGTRKIRNSADTKLASTPKFTSPRENNKIHENTKKNVLRHRQSSTVKFDDYFRSIGRPCQGEKTPRNWHVMSIEGSDTATTYRDIYLSCPEKQHLHIPDKAIVLAAYYGDHKNFKRGADVTERVIELLRRKKQHELFADETWFGEPWYGVHKTLIVKIRTIVNLKDDEEILCDRCGSLCFAGAVNSGGSDRDMVGSLSCRHCAKSCCLRCVAPLGWECETCVRTHSHAPHPHLNKTSSSVSSAGGRDRNVSLHEDGYATRLALPKIQRYDTNDSLESPSLKMESSKYKRGPKLEGFLYKRGKSKFKVLGAKGYVKLWISVDAHGRLSWRGKPGMPEKNSVSLEHYVVRESPGHTDFRLVLKADSPKTLRKEVLLRSMSVGDRHRWVVGLRSWYVGSLALRFELMFILFLLSLTLFLSYT